MSKIIFNADDFGYTEAINYGIIDAFKFGILKSTTIMANMPGFYHAVDLSKVNKDLGVGVHLVLTSGKPLTNIGGEYLNENGEFKRRNNYFIEENDISLRCDWIDPHKVYLEWKAQIDKVITNGIIPTHLDSHHHIHTHSQLETVVNRLSSEYGLLVRNTENKKFNDLVNYFDISFDSIATSENLNIEALENMILKNKDFLVSEIMCHPSYINKFLMNNSSFNITRIYETDTLMNNEFKNLLIKHNIELINYRDLNKGR